MAKCTSVAQEMSVHIDESDSDQQMSEDSGDGSSEWEPDTVRSKKKVTKKTRGAANKKGNKGQKEKVPTQRGRKRKKDDSGVVAKRQKTSQDESSENEHKIISCENEETDVKMANEFTFTVEDILEEKGIGRQWKDEELVAETCNIPIQFARNILHLLDQECTVPFIVRYRSEMTGNLPAEKVREVEMAYAGVKALRKKVQNVLKALAKQVIDPKVVHAFLNAKTIEEVEYLYAPFKPGSKRSLAERAKSLGLGPVANDLLDGKRTLHNFDFSSLVNPNVAGLSTVEKVKKGIQNIIADIIAKDREVLDFIHHSPDQHRTLIMSHESASAVKEDKQAMVEGKQTQNFKFENYYNFNCSVDMVSAHQVMAINRGETQKVLTVKFFVQPCFHNSIINKCQSRFLGNRSVDPLTRTFMNDCIEDAYTRLLEPHICRHIRSELTKKAEKESVAVFCSNLKRLLLTPPIRGNVVIGIDPGYKHGCKVAVVSCTGEVMCTDVIYPHSSSSLNSNAEKLVNMVSKYGATIIAIGNGTACRQTEAWLSNLIKNGSFPHEVKYCIVNESGASVYSVTKEAEEDLPGLEPNLRSAVSIARRLQDPLLEYVKIEPKHLGVGMYQHDVPEAMLKSALDSVVVECVSFVGVDLNVCPLVLLRKISGLSAAKAKQIIEWREKNGGFINRQQLLEVKGLGPKSFEQCAGFVKILPQTSRKEKSSSSEVVSVGRGKKKNAKAKTSHLPNLLDTTVIHPESYDIGEKFLKEELNASFEEIGTFSLVEKVKDYKKFTSVETVAKKFDVPCERVKLIMDAFSQLMEYDIRAEFDIPLFQTGVMSLQDLSVNQVLTGRVTNVTNFGAFVDIGVGTDGLVHVSQMGGRSVHLGDRLTVKVLSVDVQKKRISLQSLGETSKTDIPRALPPVSPKDSPKNKVFMKPVSKNLCSPPEFKYVPNNSSPSIESENTIAVRASVQEPQPHGLKRKPDDKGKPHTDCSNSSSKTTINSLLVDDVLNGHVVNVTDFGAFVNIGVGINGLIHVSRMSGRTVCVGDRVRVRILNINVARKRISLQLLDNDSPEDSAAHCNISTKESVNTVGTYHNTLRSSKEYGEPQSKKPCNKTTNSDTERGPKFEEESKQRTKSLRDVREGEIYHGRVVNITSFGAFVDVGVGRNGLIHISKIRRNLHIGERFPVKVLLVNVAENKLNLEPCF